MSDERTDWLDWRRQGIGASDVAGIIGISPWASPFSVWADKAGLTPDVNATDAMMHGLYAEKVIGPWFTDRTGQELHGVQLRWEHPDHPWARCTLDGFAAPVPALSAADAIVEMKATGDSVADWADGPPAHYKAQATWQSYVTGIDRVLFAVIHLAFGRPRFEVYEYEPTDQQWLAETVESFWNDHVLAGIPPEADGSNATSDAIGHVWGSIEDPDDQLMADDQPEVIELVDRWKQVRADRLAAEKAEQAAANALKATLADCSQITVAGQPIASWKAQTSTRISTSAIKDAEPELAAKYTTTTTVRVLRPHEPKGKKTA